MRYIGSVLRYLLNINTIWALMILIGFMLCLVQQVLPSTTIVPTDAFARGTNELTITLPDPDGEMRAYAFEVSFDGGSLEIEPHDRKPDADRPWLIDADVSGGSVRIVWEYEGHGAYTMAVGDEMVKKGQVVRLESLTDAAFNKAQAGFELALALVASMVMLLGLMRVGQDAGIVQLVARVFYPVIRFMFPQVPKEHPANGAILMNITTTILGLGNAATPFGLKAMKELQDLNPSKDVATDSQVMLLGYNTAGLAIIPTTLLAARKAAGCSDPTEIIGTCIVAGATATVVAIIMAKLLANLPFFSWESAVAETSGADHPPVAPGREVESGDDQAKGGA